ncbi:DUF3526 domain-containing protein [Larkinella harenae]
MKLSFYQLVFSQELKILTRSHVLTSIFALVAAMLVSSIWIGTNRLQKQNETLVNVRQSEKALRDTLKTRITQIRERGLVYEGYIWNDPTFVYNAARNEGSAYAVKPVFSLQALSLGQSDIQPFYYKVNIAKKQALLFEEEIYNSFLHFLGHFDFSFVVVFLLPLVIIVFTYNILSSEKEQGTWVLLKTSNVSIARLLLAKMTLRYGLIAFFFWGITLIILLNRVGASFLTTPNWWWLFSMVSLYFLFWFALTLLVNSFSMNSGMNAVTLMLVWLFTSVLVPGILQIGLDKTYPIPNRVEMLNRERDAVNAFFANGGAEISRDVFDNPLAQIRQAQYITPIMIYGYGLLNTKTTPIKDAATNTAEVKLYAQIQKQQAAIRTVQFFSPALMMQETLSGLAGTHWHQFNRFSQDVTQFRKELETYFFPKMQTEETYRSFSVADAEAIPKFVPADYRRIDWMNLKTNFLFYLVISLIFVAVGYSKMLGMER